MRFQRSMTVLLSLCMTIGMFGVNLFARSSTASANGQTLTAEMWRVAEIGMSSAVAYSNPFLDVEVTATFTGPGGEVVVRPGFWDGGNEWKVRFAPTALGEWSYRISSSDPFNAGLKLNGTLTAVPYTGDREIYQRGFLRVSDEGSHLSYADGTPFFWLGDTHWFFDKNESWDTSNKPGTSSQFKSIVDRRVAQKFTVYQSVIFGPHDSYWAAGQQGTEINPDYFKNELDRKMAYIADSGLVNAFGIGFHSNIDGFVQGSERLAAYVAARYGAYPVVWITSGEGAGYDLGPREARIDGWRSVGKAINKYDGYNHPQTAHSTALTEKESLGLPQFYEGEGWFDFEMFQGGHQKMVPSGDYDYYHRQYGLPFLESEANYEQIYNGWATDTIVRQSAYRSVQAGGMGYGYGAHGIWNASWDDADTANDYGYGHRNWYDAIDFVGADDRHGILQAMEHLIGLGHRRIAFLCANEGISTGRNRYHAYREGLAAHGLPIDTALIYFAYGTRENGLKGIQQVLDAAEPPTAAICMNDLAAFGAMLGLRHRGRETGVDFSIVGCDDVKEAAQWFPALTTIHNFQNQMGAKSAEFLLQRIADPSAPQKRLLLTPELVLRGTTCPPR